MGQVTVMKVVEGPAHLVIRVDMLADGTGELKNYVILSPSDLNPSMPNDIPAFRIMQMWYGMVWYDITLKAGTTVPRVLWTIARDCDSHVDFRAFGGIIDANAYNAPPSDDNGKLTISTNGFSQPNSAGSLIIELRKTNQASV